MMVCCCRPTPVSESNSWMSSNRQGAPLIEYSDSPVRQRALVIQTSEKSIGQQAGRVIDRERDLGPSEAGPLGRPRKDHVFHLRGTQRARPLRTEDPGHRVDDVGLARPVRAHDDGNPRFELEG